MSDKKSFVMYESWGAAIEKMQATLEAARGMNDRPSLSGALKENAGRRTHQGDLRLSERPGCCSGRSGAGVCVRAY